MLLRGLVALVGSRKTRNPRGVEFKQQEQKYLTAEIVHRVVWDYCDSRGIKRLIAVPVQPSGTKSLLTVQVGWHPRSQFLFGALLSVDPVALACIDYGYNVVPSQSDKGNLLNDPFDERCTEWLIEIPVNVSWAI